MTLPRTPSFRLDGRRALVTGASSGIGLGAAVALAEAGAHVTLLARGADRLDQICNEMRAAGHDVARMTGDVTDIPALGATLSAADPFDILVNNAGAARNRPFLQAQEDDYDLVMDVNVRSVLFLSQMVAERLVAEARPGSIITISSQMGHVGGPDRAIYAASKHAVEGMTKAMSIELGPMNIRVNTIAPTFIKTPLTEPTFADPDKVAWLKSKIKLDRLGEVEDIMGAVLYLASDASALVTGACLRVDGGWTAG